MSQSTTIYENRVYEKVIKLLWSHLFVIADKLKITSITFSNVENIPIYVMIFSKLCRIC